MKNENPSQPPAGKPQRIVRRIGALAALAGLALLAGAGCNDTVARTLRQGAFEVFTYGVDQAVGGLRTQIGTAIADATDGP